MVRSTQIAVLTASILVHLSSFTAAAEALSAPVDATTPICDNDVPYLILSNIRDGEQICSQYLNRARPVSTSTDYETITVETIVETAATPTTTAVVTATSVELDVVTVTSVPRIITTLEPAKRAASSIVVPAHVLALGAPRISSACSCVITTADVPDTVLTTVTTSVTASTITTPAAATVQVTSTTVQRSTSTTLVAPAPLCTQTTMQQMLLNGGFEDSLDDITPWDTPFFISNFELVAGFSTSGRNSLDFLYAGDNEELRNNGIYISQDVTLCAGANYLFGMRYSVNWAATSYRDKPCQFRISVGDRVAFQQDIQLGGGPNQWQALIFNYLATTAETQKVKVQALCVDESGHPLLGNTLGVFVDDISLIFYPQVIS